MSKEKDEVSAKHYYYRKKIYEKQSLKNDSLFKFFSVTYVGTQKTISQSRPLQDAQCFELQKPRRSKVVQILSLPTGISCPLSPTLHSLSCFFWICCCYCCCCCCFVTENRTPLISSHKVVRNWSLPLPILSSTFLHETFSLEKSYPILHNGEQECYT